MFSNIKLGCKCFANRHLADITTAKSHIVQPPAYLFLVFKYSVACTIKDLQL
jgi:hypothetical protein